MPARFAAVGDRHAAIDESPCALDALLELSARQEREGLGDAPWPPHYAKQEGEPPRVAPSRKKSKAPSSGRRVPSKPLVEIARAARKDDAMRGRSSTWTRVRVNLEHVPEELRPAPEPPDPDYDPWAGVRFPPGESPRRPGRTK
jgi:hypothetical protein